MFVERPFTESLDGQDIEHRLRLGCDHAREERHMLGVGWHPAHGNSDGYLGRCQRKAIL
jgi:hypothetical protein